MLRRSMIALTLSLCTSLGNSAAAQTKPDYQAIIQQAKQGNVEAQNNLGVMYDKGYGVPQNKSKARQWYEKAAAQGHPHALLGLGNMYANGHGVRKNHAKAKEWFSKSCDEGLQDGCDAHRNLK